MNAVLSLLWRLAIPAAAGAVTGASVAAASGLVEHWCLPRLAALPGALPAALVPLAILVTAIVTRYVTRAEEPSTSELFIVTYHRPDGRVPMQQVPGRLLAAGSTVALGGSQGLESASVLIGTAWSQCALLQRAASEEIRRTALAAGASAGIAAVFSSPSLGALYGMEMPFRRDVDGRHFVPCAIAAACSFLVRDWLIGSSALVAPPSGLSVDRPLLLGSLVVAIACGVGARLFARLVEHMRRWAGRTTPPLRFAGAGAALAAVAWIGFAATGSWVSFGPGYIAADWALAAAQPIGLLSIALFARVAGNLICVYGGGGGGVFTSLACNGLLIGLIAAEWVGSSQRGALALLGAACFLGSGYRLALACLLYFAEAGGGAAMIPVAAAAIAIGQAVMGDRSVSDAQRNSRD